MWCQCVLLNHASGSAETAAGGVQPNYPPPVTRQGMLLLLLLLLLVRCSAVRHGAVAPPQPCRVRSAFPLSAGACETIRVRCAL